MATMQMKPVGFFKADPKNPRTSADEKDLDHLGDDMLARGVLVPLLAKPDGTIIDGWRRWLAAGRKGIKELPVIITDKPEAEIKGIQLATVFHRADLTGHEKWLACAELMCMNPGWQLKDLAEFLHLGASAITKLLSPSKCSAAWQQALAAGRVGISDCYAASSLPEADQAALLALKLSGANRDAIVDAGRKSRNGNTPAVKLSKVKIAMPQATVVISGKGLSMSEVVDLLAETLKEARKAANEFDVKTWQSMMKDKAKAAR
jgi:ParB family transcriptional regulator, chromosome partitioning protein